VLRPARSDHDRRRNSSALRDRPSRSGGVSADFVRDSAAVTRRWALGAVSLFIAGITGCLNPPPRVETPGAPPASQTVAAPVVETPRAPSSSQELAPPAVETPDAPSASQEVAPPGVAGAETTPKANRVWFLPPQIGTMQKISGADPQFPAELQLPGRTYVVSAKICVSIGGVVDSVSILAGDQPALATNVVNAVKQWRYTPATVNGGTVRFCYVARFDFKAT